MASGSGSSGSRSIWEPFSRPGRKTRRGAAPLTEQQLASRTRGGALTPEEEEEARRQGVEQVPLYRPRAVLVADYH